MAYATRAPNTASADLPPPRVSIDEEEPLLGRPGANTLPPGHSLGENLLSGTAPIAQAGGLLLAGVVFYRISQLKWALFNAHPILNVLGIAILLQSALLLQPTHTAEQKRTGAIVHSVLNGVAAALLYSGLAVIVVNKLNHHGTHFESPHAILGLTTYIALFLNATLGIVQFYFPGLVGGVDNGKKLYKHHRLIGYAGVVLILATLVAATYTTYNVNAIHIPTWTVIVAGVLILAGALPRVKLQKFGLKTGEQERD